MIEKVVRLPAELKRTLLTKAEILEQRKVERQEARKTNHVSLRIADLSQGGWTGEARSVDQHRCSCGINRSCITVWIADHEWAGVDFSASVVGDRRQTCGCDCAAAVSDIRCAQTGLRLTGDG